jgi:hypothetical protein
MDSDCLRLHAIQFKTVGTLLELSSVVIYDTQDNLFNTESTILFPNISQGHGLAVISVPEGITKFVTSTQEGMSNLVHNMFQSLFQLLRLEMGIIPPNQIYASPEMFNDSISLVSMPYTPWPSSISMANIYRASTTNQSVLTQWHDMVDLFNTTDRVPVMQYSRTVPRLKPLGSAITSVFVSTFAMLSSIWTVFSLAASELARKYAGKHQRVGIGIVSLFSEARLLFCR